ncbi:MAG: aminotransferase class I/II-fold pyridoxal phosphate-dependent enzyme [Cyanobium sp. PLM2.Bin73]|nr:MAG: aminotransferase class I/II-fold pyridoxal phosphate-dependent enzyme [Cyanobium sp. PLM2.Bin73]
MPKLSPHLKGLTGQPSFQIFARARELEKQGRSVRHFELGDPDIDTPQEITDAAIRSLQSGNTHYTPARGQQDFLEAVQATTSLSRGFRPDIDQLTVTTGANAAIFYTIRAICEPGGEILLPNPYFPTYLSAATLAGAVPVLYDLEPANNFSPNLSTIKSLINPRTRAVLINSPSNPLGTVWSPMEIQSIYDIALENDLYLISDEVYARMIYCANSSFSSPATLDECKERVILINSFSKTFAMTGWRIGVAIAPCDVSERITLINSSVAACVPGFIQDAARAALGVPPDVTEKIYSTFRQRQIKLAQELTASGFFDCQIPQGSMYIFPLIKNAHSNSEDFAFHLLESAGIACTPGSYFGSRGEGYLRFSCAGEDSDVVGLSELIKEAANSHFTIAA